MAKDVQIKRMYDGATISRAAGTGLLVEQMIPVWPGSGPSEDCEDWPHLCGFSLTLEGDYQTNVTELEVSWVPNADSYGSFTAERTILAYEPVTSFFTQIYTPCIPFPGVPGMFPRLYVRIGATRFAYRFYAWWKWSQALRKVGCLKCAGEGCSECPA